AGEPQHRYGRIVMRAAIANRGYPTECPQPPSAPLSGAQSPSGALEAAKPPLATLAMMRQAAARAGAAMTSIPEVQKYVDALRRGYEILTEATTRATGLGTAIPERLANEIAIGRFQALELARAVVRDPQDVFSPP